MGIALLCHRWAHLYHAVLCPKLPCAHSLRYLQWGIRDSAVPAGGDRPCFPTALLTQATQEMSGTVLLPRRVSAALEQARVSLKGSACALKPDPEFPVYHTCKLTAKPSPRERALRETEQGLPLQQILSFFFNLLWALPGIWLQAELLQVEEGEWR